jgi:hypothetical protein
MDKEKEKSFWQSKTFWGNIVAVVGTIFGSDAVGAELGTEEVAVGFGILNLALRYVTNTKIVW